MNLELGPILDVFPNASKDARRIGLFVTACQKKAIELVMSNGDYKGFAQELFAEVSQWAPKKKWGFFDWLTKKVDKYYADRRESIRMFGEKWQLDQLFLKEMG
jgi:hypothetical protein